MKFLLTPSAALRFLGLLGLLFVASCTPKEDARISGRLVLEYWEKWTGFEREAMARVVDDFNNSQDKVFVRFLSVSRVDQKMMLATAGGVPPDVVGLWAINLPSYAENNALMPLDYLAKDAGIRQEEYLPVFWKLCSYRGFLWALPSTPSVTALHWNKKMFREAGLDPEQPPRTIAELETFNTKLTRKNSDGSLAQIGHMPQEPGWWMHDFPSWFGGASWDGSTKLLLDAEPNRHFFTWLESYPKRFGGPAMFELRGGFGNFASPDNPFFNGKVAMIMQGVWMNNFIKKYAPAGFEYGAAAFPEETEHPGSPLTIAETDILVIPAGARHPKEAMQFIAFVAQQKNTEKLCLGQHKISPLRKVSDEFMNHHSHPYLKVFQSLANSSRAQPTLSLPTFKEYANDMITYVNLVLLGRMGADEARVTMLARQQKALDAKVDRWNKVAPVRVALWEKEIHP